VDLSEESLAHKRHGSGSKPSLFVFFSGGISPKREIKKVKIRKKSDFGGFQSPKFERKNHIHMFGFHYVSEKYGRMITDLYFISGL